MQSPPSLQAVSPALAQFAEKSLFGEVWQRPDLSIRDRCVVTLAALIARVQTAEMHFLMEYALDAGVKPSEISEIITHLAFYSGWGNAVSAAGIAEKVFTDHGISTQQLPTADEVLLPLDQAAEIKRASQVATNYAAVSSGVVEYTGDVLFKNLWLRPGLTPRDRSLVTVSALIASGQVGQITFHLNRAMDNGLTQPQASEMLTQLAFYAGWPSVFSAMPVVKEVFEKRPH